jgi:DNA-binding transcriptional ArsR family regulator
MLHFRIAVVRGVSILKYMLQHSRSLDSLFHALADPSRRLMVERLTRGPASTSELARPLTMSLSAVAQHIKVLESSGLVRSEKRGRERVCHIERKALGAAENWITKRRAMLERQLDGLAKHLGETEEPPRTRRAK